jgi:hypothetical protein
MGSGSLTLAKLLCEKRGATLFKFSDLRSPDEAREFLRAAKPGDITTLYVAHSGALTPISPEFAKLKFISLAGDAEVNLDGIDFIRAPGWPPSDPATWVLPDLQ